MRDTYWKIKIVLQYPSNFPIESVTYLCKPGKDIECIALRPRGLLQHTPDENTPLLPRTPDDNTPLLQHTPDDRPGAHEEVQDQYIQNDMERKYRQYYKKALEVQGSIMTKMDEFDFFPSLLNVNIPLNSQGYFE